MQTFALANTIEGRVVQKAGLAKQSRNEAGPG